ncbi:glycosyl hydrolase [Ideonella sp. BN130291]|uniref:glycosyl hydrolase n=1 Tax=Ideonella sp. BN130291 TaxID=3112940 RepID=UPI002E27436D|nr:glycosyl hydrolase [Ideonella sp. BN130291]
MRAGRIPTAVAALLLACAAPAARAEPSLVIGPYKHAPLAFDAHTHLMQAAPADTTPAQPLAQALAPGAVVSWAFATGDCGNEHWGDGIVTERFAQANVAAFVQAKQRYIVSTGGQGQQFHCDSDEGMERFIARYASPQLVGFDFDIEAGQSDASINALVRQIARAQARHPGLRMSFTLPTFAASDGSGRSLNRIGQRVLAALRKHRVRDPYINLMVMNYGRAHASRCVLKATPEGQRCDMARSALRAAQNLHEGQRVPMNHIELTAMIGVNDVVENVFTLADAEQLGRAVREQGLGGLHWWSLDRDTPCPPAEAGVSPRCSGLAQPPQAYSRAFLQALP